MTDKENIDQIVETLKKMGPATFEQLGRWCKDLNVRPIEKRMLGVYVDFQRAYNAALVAHVIVPAGDGRVTLA